MIYQKAIQRILDQAEARARGIKILFAVESGSRLWGMQSADSDYDVRFVYARKITDYLKLGGQSKDTMELTDKEYNIDAVGWDVKKFLGLAYKSNPSALEWILSDIVYRGSTRDFRVLLKALNQRSLYEHYHSMAKSNYMRYIEDTEYPQVKKYLYVLRSIAASLYILKHNVMPPVQIAITMKLLPIEIEEEFKRLIDMKMRGVELNALPLRLSMLDDYIDEYLKLRQKHTEGINVFKQVFHYRSLNTLFLESIGYI